MSEGTFRAVVASVLIGALALAVVVAGSLLLPRSPTPAPSASVATSSPLRPTPTPAPTPSPGPAFGTDIISVGQIPRGGESGKTLVLQFLESGVDAIPDAAGSFRVTLIDHAGDGTTVRFVGTPAVEAPGSVGATVTLAAANVLQVSIVASDRFNVESISIRGLGIGVSTSAALGALEARIDDRSGSLATGVPGNLTGSPGIVVASP